MKSLIFSFLAILLSSLSHAQPERVEPPSWWAGMKDPGLQLLVKGEGIGDMKVKADYPGLKITSVDRADSPDYLFINFDLSGALPGSFTIEFTGTDRQQISYEYVLNKREPGSELRRGFDASDVMYLVMPDRFANGDIGNDEVKGMREGLNRSEPYGRHGGDIQGIVSHLDYISSMGFTAVWLNPVLENDMDQWSYHGYAATDFYRVDRRFGTNDDYRELSRKASSMGIKLIMDMIFNHCGSSHWWMENPPFNDWINNYPDYRITSHRRTVNIDPHASEADTREMTDGWFVPSMPDLNQRNPWMAQYLIQNSIWWIEYAGLAGIRMDTYPYPDKIMMAEWNRRVLNEYPGFTIVGEEWSLNPVVVSYWQKGQSNIDGYDGMIPSMMDFPLQSAVVQGLTEKEDFNTGLVKIYEALANDILYPDPSKMVIFPDNHDMPRFYMQLGMNDDLYRLGISFFLTTRGVPQIFYGSEILMTHTEGNDHGHIRKDFPGGWPGDQINAFTGNMLADNQADMQEFFRKVLNWRKECSVMHNGKLMHFAPRDGVYAYFRYNSNARVMVIINKNTEDKELGTDRFKEMLEGYPEGKDIVSDKLINMKKGIKLKPLTPMIIELREVRK